MIDSLSAADVLRHDQIRKVLSRATIADCWEWRGSVDRNGYGTITKKVYGEKYVHRFVWIGLVGPIPAGLVLDHLCRNVRCCNPDHLEPVTIRENLLRGLLGAANCRNGHNDWYVRPNGYRVCNECRRNRYRRDHGVVKVRGKYKEGVVSNSRRSR